MDMFTATTVLIQLKRKYKIMKIKDHFISLTNATKQVNAQCLVKAKPAFLALGLLVSGSSYAGNYTIGGLIGQSNIDAIEINCLNIDCDVDDSDTAIGINLGYQFTNAWGIELGYLDLGSVSLNESILGFNVNFKGDLSAAYLAGRGTYEFSDHWSITGRLGAAKEKAKASLNFLSQNQAVSDSAEAVYAGVSIDYRFTDSVKAGLRFDQIADDGNALALNLEYSFGK